MLELVNIFFFEDSGITKIKFTKNSSSGDDPNHVNGPPPIQFASSTAQNLKFQKIACCLSVFVACDPYPALVQKSRPGRLPQSRWAALPLGDATMRWLGPDCCGPHKTCPELDGPVNFRSPSGTCAEIQPDLVSQELRKPRAPPSRLPKRKRCR